MSLGRSLLSLLFGITVAGFASGQVPDRNAIPNWPVSATWTPPRASGITAMVETNPLPFIAVTPCRLLDTRPPANNPLDGDGAYTANQTRSYTIPPHCGIPVGAEAVSVNMTATNTGAHPFGHLKIWPVGQPEPNVSTLNWAAGGVTVANAAIAPLSDAGALNVKSGNTGSDVIIDVNGYFSQGQNAGNRFAVLGSSGAAMILGQNSSSSFLSIGVEGFATADSGVVFGIFGLSFSNSDDSAGVIGRADIAPDTFPTVFSKAGVRGESEDGYGTIGISEVTAVAGFLMNSDGGTFRAYGVLGSIFGTDPDGGGPPWAVHATGNIGATGMKQFLEPHPSDPTRVIQYVALEGPEAGTYFRGRARFQRGLARIPVPEDFRLVTDPEGLTVQITPIGEMASFAVVRMSLDEVVVKASRDVEFSYLVQGVRASFKDVQPVIRDGSFVPQSAEARMPGSLADRQKRILIENGTYNRDGSVNMETARRLGWDRMWERRSGRLEPRPPGDASP